MKAHGYRGFGLKAVLRFWVWACLLWSCSVQPSESVSSSASVDYYVYILEPIESFQDSSLWTAQAKEVYQSHLDYLKELYKTKKAVILSRTALPTYDKNFFSMCYLKTYEAAEAQALAYNDPAVLSGLMKVKLFPVILVKK
jgi:uncharacterized protein YciI